VPLFSGFSSIYQQKSLTSQYVQVQFDRQNVQNQVNLNQVTSRKKLETARDSILTDIEALKLATKSSTEARRAFRFATIDALHFLTVQQSYVQSEQALDIARYNYIVALANYYIAYGQDMDSLVDLLEKANQ
jgi:outer membrane protein TolC